MPEHPAPEQAKRPKRWSSFIIGLLAMLTACNMPSPAGAGRGDEPEPARAVFRLAFTSSMFAEVKVDDARAAMKVWMLAIARDRGIPVDPEPKIYDSLEELSKTLRSGLVDGVGATAEEFWRLRKGIELDRLVVGIQDNRIADEYIVLVHRESGIKNVEALRGRRLLLPQNPRMSLATVWLDTHLMQKGLEPAERFLGAVTSVNKLSQVVLRVFFRQSDACLVTRRGFETMNELNPQLGMILNVIAASPELVPTGFAFLSRSSAPLRDQMLGEMTRLSDSVAGQQILTLIQADRVEERPFSCMARAFELLSIHQRLTSSEGKATGGAPRPLSQGAMIHIGS
jgi:phosphonate transport system substrate-binding protein